MTELYEPSPIEIWKKCCEIQATWTREEEIQRRGAGVSWHPPGCAGGVQMAGAARYAGRSSLRTATESFIDQDR